MAPKKSTGDAGMDNVIKVMNKLYDITHTINMESKTNVKIQLPQIVVCGSQSVGKTSVLEKILREEILPRGTDMQTRCPIVLQLIRTNDNSKWVEFLHVKGEKFTDMNEVKAEIDKVSKNIADSGQVVSEDPITLKLFSPDVTNLTLVDLPGMMERADDGLPETLVNQINDLALKYVSNENCLILAISSATEDINLSKAIRLAEQVDPKGQRTLGVLTKLDLMDEGTTAHEVLQGKRIQVGLGMIGIVNRSFMDIQHGKSLQDQLSKERQFFNTVYPYIANQHGTPFLIQRISNQLLRMIRDTLPEIKVSLNKLIEAQQQAIEKLDGLEVQEDNKDAYLFRLLANFAETYRDQVDGRRRNLHMNHLNASARIKLLYDKLGAEFDKLEAAKNLTPKDIHIAILNSHGLHSRHVGYDDAFQQLVKRDIKELGPLISQCASHVCEEMQRAIATSCDPTTMDNYPRLYQKIRKTALALINEQFKDCQRDLENYLNAEVAIARTIHGGFREKNGYYEKHPRKVDFDLKSEPNAKFPEDDLPEEGITFEDAATHRANVVKDIKLYFDTAKMQILEHVAKSITYQLVYGTTERINEYMVLNLHLHTPETAEELLVDVNWEEVKENRETAAKTLSYYEDAHSEIETILLKIGKL